MAHTTLKNGQIISLDSLDARIISLNETLERQSEQLTDQIELNHSMIQQLKVANIYKSYETDIVVDGEIFNEEKDN